MSSSHGYQDMMQLLLGRDVRSIISRLFRSKQILECFVQFVVFKVLDARDAMSKRLDGSTTSFTVYSNSDI